MAALTLRIEPTDPSPSWKARWSVDATAVGDFIDVTGAQVKAILDVGHRFRELFEMKQSRPLADPEALRAIGRSLFDVWFAPARDLLKPVLDTAGPRALILQFDDPKLLDLPWELIELAPGLPIGCDANWSLRRASLSHTDSSPSPARPGPLRVLFLASAPTDQHQLDYEREEDLMLRASADVKGEIVAHFAETGGIDELAALVAECWPHVVHLSGHGDVNAKGQGVFAFEDERGKTDLRTADEIATRVFRGNDVRMAFINGCKTSQAAVSGLCRGLVAAGVPSALGWAASVFDDRATDFAAEFYRRLVRNEPAPTAAAHARDAICRNGLFGSGEHKAQDATFALPQLYGMESSALFDPSTRETYLGPRTVPALLGDGIKGLKSGYVGRRREIQRLVPALRQGETTFAMLTGIGGTGKSTLATRAANRLQAVGYGVVAVKVTERPTPAEAGRDAVSRTIGALDDAFLEAGRKDLHALLTDGDTPVGQRLRMAVRGLNELKLVLVLDNFEDALDLETRRIADPDLAGFIEALAKNLIHGSRAIVTCRYLPEGTPTDLPNVLHLPLPEFLGHDALKFLRRDEVVDRRISEGELTRDLIDRLHNALGGTPGLLVQVRTLLRKADPEALLEELQGGDPGLLAQEREAYCSKILTARLYAALSSEAQAITRRVALSILPIPGDAVATLVDLTETLVAGQLDEGVAYGLLQRFDEHDLPSLYHPPGLLRPWLTAPERLTADEAKAVHTHLAAFWRSSYEADREPELRVAINAELDTCRDHARHAADGPTFQWATLTLARRLVGRSEWNLARGLLAEVPPAERDAGTWHALATIDLNQGDYAAARDKFATAMEIKRAIGDHAGEASTWHQLATIDLKQGNYAAARDKFAMSMEIRRAIGDRAGEASTWHQLATIDLNQGDYAAARDKFATAMEIARAIGDRAGEASTWHQLATIDVHQGDYAAARDKFANSMEIKRATGNRAGEAGTWYQLGVVAYKLGRGDDAVRLITVAFLISNTIGNSEAKTIARSLATLCGILEMDQVQVQAILSEATSEYQKDGGQSLLERAFRGEVSGGST